MVVTCKSGKTNSPCCCAGDGEDYYTTEDVFDGSDGTGSSSSSSCGHAVSSSSILVQQATGIKVESSSPVDSLNKSKSTATKISASLWKRGTNNLYDQYQDYSYDDESTDESCFSHHQQNDDGTNNETINVDDDPWTYSGKRLQALQFPLGGFGTGQITFQGDGSLQGFTILNQFHNHEYSPLHKLPGFLFGIQATTAATDNENGGRGREQGRGDHNGSHRTGRLTQSFVLQTPQNYTNRNCKLHVREEAHVTNQQVQRMTNLPGIRSLTCKCQYPSITVNYDIPGFPLNVQLKAMTPLIPGNIQDSSWPVAIFDFTCTNTTQNDVVEVDLMQSALNFIGWDGKTPCDRDDTNTNVDYFYQNTNIPIVGGNDDNGDQSVGNDIRYAGWNMTRLHQEDNLDTILHGNLCLVGVTQEERPSPGSKTHAGDTDTSSPCSKTQLGLLVSNDKFDENQLWDQFVQRRWIKNPIDAKSTIPTEQGRTYMGAVIQSSTIQPNTTQSFRFVLSWYFPNRPSYSDRPNLPSPILGNRYAHWYQDAVHVMKSLLPKSEYLMSTTKLYVDTLYASKIPFQFLESAAGRLACMRSPTMFWTKDDGIILGNEGNNCCPLNCSHVYGYTTLLERLYPDVAKDMLYSNFVRNFDQDHGCSMRYGRGGYAIDGSLACVIKVLLVVQQADSKFEFLKQVWPNVKRQMVIIFDQFDTCGDGVIRCPQQNTYDSAMQEANTFIGSYWVTALKAASIMATWMNDSKFASRCISRAKLSAQNYERICWMEEFGYYIADVDVTNCKHSYATGCFVDQLCAIGLSTACGLGTVFDPVHEATARLSILKHNLVSKPPFQDLQKHFYDGDTGITVTTYPHGKLPDCGAYDTLVSTGFTYPVVAGLLFDGSIEAASTIAKNIRSRHSGINRSPWNEPECGLLYSRSMASWNLYDQACGFTYDSSRGAIGVVPKVKLASNFDCFIVTEDGWGQFRQERDAVSLQSLYGSIVVKSLRVDNTCAEQAVTNLQGNHISSQVQDGLIVFDGRVLIPTGATLTVHLSCGSDCAGSSQENYVSSTAAHQKHPPQLTKSCNLSSPIRSDVEKCCCSAGSAMKKESIANGSHHPVLTLAICLIVAIVCWGVIYYQ